ncbi:MAG: glycosyltransferase [Steroidobacteraceae bacterium]
MKLGYLIAQYPAVNHTYILREVLSLRRRGFDIYTVSVRQPDRTAETLSDKEAEEESRTFSVLGAGVFHALVVNLRVLTRHPVRYLQAITYAWALTRGTPSLLLSYTFYFFEAVVAGHYFTSRGVRNIHTHFASTVLLLLSRVFPIRYSMTLHGSGEFVDVVGFHLAEKVRYAQFVVTISLFGRSQVLNASDSAHWHKVIVVPLGVDTDEYAPRSCEAREPGAPLRVISVGHLSQVKGYPLLIEAVQRLLNSGRSVQLTLVGEGSARRKLEELIANLGLESAVRLAGACNHDRVPDFLAGSHVFAMSSFLEGVPVVLMEAMAMELPCVATRITGIPELIDDEIDGLLVPPGSAAHLAEAIGRLADDSVLARRLGAAGRAKIRAQYELSRNAERLCETFTQQWMEHPLDIREGARRETEYREGELEASAYRRPLITPRTDLDSKH